VYVDAADGLRRLLGVEHPVKREKRGMSQREPAEASGVGSGYIGDIEAGRKSASVDALRRFAKLLRAELDWLAPTPPSQG
jgi:transcriptional regulator with XRE-family HTH domain